MGGVGGGAVQNCTFRYRIPDLRFVITRRVASSADLKGHRGRRRSYHRRRSGCRRNLPRYQHQSSAMSPPRSVLGECRPAMQTSCPCRPSVLFWRRCTALRTTVNTDSLPDLVDVFTYIHTVSLSLSRFEKCLFSVKVV